MLVYRIINQEGYLNLLKRVETGEKYLEGKWQDPKYSREVKHFQAMANACLIWEIDSNILIPLFDKWLLEK